MTHGLGGRSIPCAELGGRSVVLGTVAVLIPGRMNALDRLKPPASTHMRSLHCSHYLHGYVCGREVAGGRG
jgi:hypothetical protein